MESKYNYNIDRFYNKCWKKLKYLQNNWLISLCSVAGGVGVIISLLTAVGQR